MILTQIIGLCQEKIIFILDNKGFALYNNGTVKNKRGEKDEYGEGKGVSSELLDLKTISEKLETLPHDSLMYVAGAISALAAANTVPPLIRL